MTEALLPCPLCGNPPAWKADMYLHQILHCKDCRLEVRADPAIAFIYTKNADKRERDQITKIWNGRCEVGIPATAPPPVSIVRVTEAMVNAADSVLSRRRPGIPDETIRLAIMAALDAAESPPPVQREDSNG